MGRRRYLLLALTVLWSGCRATKPGAAVQANVEPPPELSMIGLTVQSWGPDGLEWILRAPVGEGFTRRDILQVSSMTVQLFDKGERSTEIAAKRAVMATGDRPKPGEAPKMIHPAPGINLVPGDMYMDGGVVVVSTEGSKLSTDWVQYYVNEEVIRSSAPVEVRRPDSITRGRGLEATADLSRLSIYNETLIIPGGDEK